jgi:hypothetical protein
MVRGRTLAVLRKPSKITPGPPGSWPLRFDRLVQPVLDRSCVSCHRPESVDLRAARFDLTAPNAYQNLMSFAGKDLEGLAFERDRSVVGDCPARQSRLLSLLTEAGGHEGLRLDSDGLNRLVVWMDVYAQTQGFFSVQQEKELEDFRRRVSPMLIE